MNDLNNKYGRRNKITVDFLDGDVTEVECNTFIILASRVAEDERNGDFYAMAKILMHGHFLKETLCYLVVRLVQELGVWLVFQSICMAVTSLISDYLKKPRKSKDEH